MRSSNGKFLFSGSRFVIWTALSLAFLVVAMSPLFGQEKFGELNGRTTDATGTVLVDVNVNATNNLTGIEFTTKTLSDGTYVMRALDPGRYTVRFEVLGFAPREYQDVIIAAGGLLTIDSELRLRPSTHTAKAKRR